jgi:NADP-dependent 3-hydroxy acid dehydrogenase YdfG
VDSTPKPLVVVTGASHGIGRAIAAAFAADGHPLLLVARHAEKLDGIASKTILQAAVDVADYAALEAAIRDAERVHGPTSCIVNNAGFLRIRQLQLRDPAEMSYEIDVLLKVCCTASARCCRAWLRAEAARSST